MSGAGVKRRGWPDAGAGALSCLPPAQSSRTSPQVGGEGPFSAWSFAQPWPVVHVGIRVLSAALVGPVAPDSL